ncbi:MAG: ATP-binding protein [Micrococcales bacterium]|nr:ATP-binding protein [Micrococcales bacterium]
MAGLPGSGKSTLGARLGEALGATLISVDPLESAILSAGIDADQPTGLAAYLVAESLAHAVLTAGRPVVLDAVNAVVPAREQWTGLAERHGVPIGFVEVRCSDEALHRRRLEERHRGIPQVEEVGWHRVEEALDEWEPWSGPSGSAPRITLDTVRPLAELRDEAIAFLERLAPERA